MSIKDVNGEIEQVIQTANGAIEGLTAADEQRRALGALAAGLRQAVGEFISGAGEPYRKLASALNAQNLLDVSDKAIAVSEGNVYIRGAATNFYDAAKKAATEAMRVDELLSPQAPMCDEGANIIGAALRFMESLSTVENTMDVESTNPLGRTGLAIGYAQEGVQQMQQYRESIGGGGTPSQ
ncbi:MAG TPA: hypothetical protein VMR45_06210 [Patescibacteria group bacterium]|nr:hypothetical protein [Patescibacteria group bacterium]